MRRITMGVIQLINYYVLISVAYLLVPNTFAYATNDDAIDAISSADTSSTKYRLYRLRAWRAPTHHHNVRQYDDLHQEYGYVG